MSQYKLVTHHADDTYESVYLWDSENEMIYEVWNSEQGVCSYADVYSKTNFDTWVQSRDIVTVTDNYSPVRKTLCAACDKWLPYLDGYLCEDCATA